ncbi:LacI family DNA-binding transcriptional regulator [Halalkalibacter hemicellulosilyticus]|uniref:DNA-binding transcriptional regulator n=1 Tax=Halalkalibacter hemicellulosilyticusJCM 9152 TaxID=1236971 RepID=W4QLW3_9BACI|nr:LacI family DNA-binding transcriptional regulator [Halalkalibacter hemicellulosilyticus]GAE32339.1 DNA-binding transcriptional regulator [Halalkalibacter hemicellulosilyticusJCM 9152]
MARKKVTMQQIADVAGVSKYVVSKTLNGKPGVSDQTREKILFIAKQLGYHSDLLRSNKTEDVNASHSSFIIVVIEHQSHHDSLYWGKIIDGIYEAVNEVKLGMMIVSEDQQVKQLVNTANLQGIIGVGHVSSEVLVELHQLAVPIVLINHEDSLVPADSIYADNMDGLYKMTNHLIAIGHRSISFVGDTSFSKSFYERWLGYRMAIEENGLQDEIIKQPLSIPYSSEFQLSFQRWVMERDEIPTAFLCANDDIAQRVIMSLRKVGYNVPVDCSVTGFDNIDSSALIKPSLSTVQVLKESIGQRAVYKLIWRREHRQFPPEKLLIKAEIVMRDSVVPMN